MDQSGKDPSVGQNEIKYPLGCPSGQTTILQSLGLQVNQNNRLTIPASDYYGGVLVLTAESHIKTVSRFLLADGIFISHRQPEQLRGLAPEGRGEDLSPAHHPKFQQATRLNRRQPISRAAPPSPSGGGGQTAQRAEEELSRV